MKMLMFVMAAAGIFLAIAALYMMIALADELEEQAQMRRYAADLQALTQPEIVPPTDMSFALTYLFVGDAETDVSEKEYWYRRALEMAYHAGKDSTDVSLH